MPTSNSFDVRQGRAAITAQLLAGTSLGLVLALSNAMAAEEGTAETVVITGSEIAGPQEPVIPQLTQPLLETPQSISVVSAQELADRAIADLNDALRNVPGISLGAGEFSWQGNTPIIRGFAARTDMFLDGIRDFGNYYRDAFNIQQIEVLQGPSSIFFGRGSTGGVINQTSKHPHFGDVASLTVAAGTDETYRAVADVNHEFEDVGEGTAGRLVGMVHHSGVAGRDVAEFERWGIAPSLAMGLGTPTRLTASYFHQTDRNVPDYGLPWLFGEPAPVPRNYFYGFDSDFLDTDADVLTARGEHDFNDAISIGSTLRYAHYSRDFRITEVIPLASTTPSTPLEDVTLFRNMWSGDSIETTLLAQADITAEFMTGGFGHTFVVGIEGGRETSSPDYENSLGVPDVGLLTPDPTQPFTSTVTFTRLAVDTTAKSFAFFAVDTVDLSPKWEMTLGFRWDYFKADFTSMRFASDGMLEATEHIVQTDKMSSYRGALVYKPAENGSIYATFGTSFNPSAESLTQVVAGRNLGPTATGNANLPPEENKTFELGTKWEMLAENLTVDAAIFRIEKTNARVPDISNPGFNMLGGKHRVDGFQITANGMITPDWMVNVGYTYLDSEVVDSVPGAAPQGSMLNNTPKHSITFFTQYSFDFGLDIGGGFQYQSERLGQNASNPVKRADGYWVAEAMAKYAVNQNIQLQLNVYNIFDEYYLSQLHPWHVVPGAARSAQLSVKFTY
jgi:catecholate siderophore receptor